MQLTRRARVSLTTDEMKLLDDYVNDIDKVAGFGVIKLNTGIGRDTITALLERGWAENHVINKLQKFLSELRETDYYRNLKNNKDV